MRTRLKVIMRVLCVSAITGLMACSQPTAMVYSGETMGTYYRVSYYGSVDYQSDIQSILSAVNNSMSSWLPESEISRFNSLPSGIPVQLSPELCEVVGFAVQLMALSDGAYDISIGKIVADLGFGPQPDAAIKSSQVSADEVSGQLELAGQQPRAGKDSLLLQGCELTRLNPQAMIDLSSIAKGFAVDQIGAFLESKDLNQYLVDIGGELRAGDYKPDGSPWRIAVEVPNIDGGIQHVIELANIAIATSGDYRNFREVAGQLESHLIDPLSGRSVHSRVTSLSVLNASAMRADAWATALFVMGPERAMEIANRSKTPVYMLLRSEQNGDIIDREDGDEPPSVEVLANSYWHDYFN